MRLRLAVCNAFVLSALVAPAVPAQQMTPIEIYLAKAQAMAMVDRGQTDSALPLLRRVARFDSVDAGLWRRYGQAAAQARRWEEAAAAFTQAYTLGAFNRASSAFQVARMQLAAGHPTAALDWLERALADRGQHPQRVREDTGFAPIRDSARLAAIYPKVDPAGVSRDERWRRDIDFFQREAQRMHVHPDRPAFSPEFTDAVAALKARVPASSDRSLRLGLRRLVVMLQDGHSGLEPDSAMRMLPIDLYVFSDGIFVVQGIGDARRHVGSRVIEIGGRKIEEVAREAAAFITGENVMTVRGRLPQALVLTDILEEIGVAAPGRPVEVLLEDAQGRRSVARLIGGPLRRSPDLSAPIEGQQPFYLDQRRPYWTRPIPAAKALYLNFNRVAEWDSLGLDAFSRRLAAELADSGYANLIVDVRMNGGGNTFLLPPLVQAIASFAVADTGRRIYVITSRHTYSAAQNFVSKLEWLVHPIFVGEPTGSAPNFTGESTGTILPYSGLQVNISNRMHMNSDWEDRRSWIAPHLPVPLSSADFFGGRDPALEAVLMVARRK